MAAFVVNCPTTGYKVQEFVADDPGAMMMPMRR
jgi:hypothetical protein